jgi:hypothetical protein
LRPQAQTTYTSWSIWWKDQIVGESTNSITDSGTKNFDQNSTYFALLVLVIAISAGAIGVYNHYTGDIGTAVSIGSYILTASAAVLAFIAIADWVGFSKPDPSTYVYDIETGVLKTESVAKDSDMAQLLSSQQS